VRIAFFQHHRVEMPDQGRSMRFCQFLGKGTGGIWCTCEVMLPGRGDSHDQIVVDEANRGMQIVG